MNLHQLPDIVSVVIGGFLAGKRKFFAESLESPSFQEIINSISLALPRIDGEGTFEVNALSEHRHLDPAYRVEKWLGADHSTFIYHHGNGERPFDYALGVKNTFYNILVREKDSIEANLICVRAPYHNFSIREYQEKMLHLGNFMEMLSAGVVLIQRLVERLRSEGSGEIIVCGVSLGGFVTNLHRSFFNTATGYAPLMAGTLLGELFATSSYRRLTSPWALKNRDQLLRLMNFRKEFQAVKDANVFPLLARHDAYVEHQVQKEGYGTHPVRTMDAGHITGALRAGELREHILSVPGLLQKGN